MLARRMGMRSYPVATGHGRHLARPRGVPAPCSSPPWNPSSTRRGCCEPVTWRSLLMALQNHRALSTDPTPCLPPPHPNTPSSDAAGSLQGSVLLLSASAGDAHSPCPPCTLVCLRLPRSDPQGGSMRAEGPGEEPAPRPGSGSRHLEGPLSCPSVPPSGPAPGALNLRERRQGHGS